MVALATVPTVLHFDLDAFFAAVEVLLDPSLAGKPVIIGADPTSRGVVATASYEARAFGVHSAMPVGHAYRLCPRGIYIRPRHGVYREHSRRVLAVVARFSDRVQQVSIDEAFVDLAAHADPVAAARELKNAIRAETGLVASLGLASSKLVAKIASDFGKPDGFHVVPVGEEASFLAPLPVRKLWGVGPKTAGRLLALGIETIGALATTPPDALVEAFGHHHAEGLLRRASGEDHSAIEVERETKSISDEHTFQRDERDSGVLWRTLRDQGAHCAARLSEKGLLARTMTVKLRYGDFRTVTRSVTLPVPTDDPSVLLAVAAGLMRQSWALDRRPLRLIGFRVSGLSPRSAPYQLPLVMSDERPFLPHHSSLITRV